MTGVDPWVGRAIGRALTWLGAKAKDARLLAKLEQQRPALATLVADRSFEELSPEQVSGVAKYLESPDFEQAALHLLINAQEEMILGVREEVREGLRLHTAMPPDRLYPITEAIFDALRTACASETPGSIWTAPGTAQIVAMTARNGRLLARLPELAAIHEQSRRLRDQIKELHRELRLPHTGASRAVPWERLYVMPTLKADKHPPQPMAPAPGRRTVILGNPGAGKSTLATKLAYDHAVDASGTVPFLVVLRDFADSLRHGERTLLEHLAVLARAPYNVAISADAVEYLLLNGRAIVILDGLDELTDVALRRRVTEFVRGFVSLYPLVPMVVTSREIGYTDAPVDRSLFDTYSIAPFDNEQVAAYARNWFELNDSLAPSDRKRLCQAFLGESEVIEDLRSNPLLLSLLCSMYASEQYLPRNRAQIYERCAVMVFERWETMRGIRIPVEFEGKLRGAIQQLAWTMLTYGGPPELPRHGVQRILVDYLRAKHFDEDDARALAQQFLAYCAGRAWVLVGVGATETEPIYGFAHRTFLEFFAAEHLVRHAPMPAQVWEKLRPNVSNASWEVVGQLALQLLDRNLEDGAESLLNLALDEAGNDAEVIEFAARACAQVGLSPRLLTRIAEAAVASVASVSYDERTEVCMSDETLRRIGLADGALQSLIDDRLRGNEPYLLRALVDRFLELGRAHDDLALCLTEWLPWEELSAELQRSLSSELAEWEGRQPWDLLDRLKDEPALLDQIVDRFGIAAFYRSQPTLSGHFSPFVVRAYDSPAVPEPVQRVRERLLATPPPWLRLGRPPIPWRYGEWILSIHNGQDRATALVLRLPYLELSDSPPEIDLDGLPADCADFLSRWKAGEFRVTAS